ncbi:dystrotelin [Gouania willdenowi]|uniref:dystrotelin n=1 Tax=Gouania willdenowi TaxID=441366 RepID=UPI0010550221|nr:dystrotelin-like [Gouania willdenowi]
MSHNVRCYTCRRSTITGLRFRCQKCLNVHVCLSCFLTGRQRKKHKAVHPLLEFSTQPTWKETLSSLARSTRYHMLPWRRTQEDSAWSTQHMWAEPKDTQDRAPPSSEETSILSADSAPSPAPSQQASHDASVSPTKSHDDQALLSDVRALQRDRSVLEAELKALRLSIQTEQSMLGNRYSEMEVSMETLRRDNVLLSQALNEIKERQTTSPTILLGTPSPETVEEHSLIGQETPEEAELQEEYSSESEDDWMSNEEAELQETVDRLRTEMKTDTWTQTGVRGAELVKASEQVGVVIGGLVTAVRQSRCKTLFNELK